MSPVSVSRWRRSLLRGGIVLLVCGIVPPAPASADQARAGQFLPNDPLPVPLTRAQRIAAEHGFGLAAIPPPPDRYQSRVGWLVAAHIESGAAPWHARETQRNIANALKRELTEVAHLPKAERESYLAALINDSTTWELAQLDNAWTHQVLGAMLVDLAAAGVQAFGSEVYAFARVLDSDMARPYGDVAGAVGGAVLSTGAGALYAEAMASGANPVAVFRAALVRQFITSRCGCPEPGRDRFRFKEASLGLHVPPVREVYRTRLGRLVAAWDQPAVGGIQQVDRLLPGVDLKGDALRRELAMMKALDPAARSAYLGLFLQDLDDLQRELVDSHRESGSGGYAAGFFASLGAGGIGIAVAPALGTVVSAIGAGVLAADSLSGERRLLLNLAATRRAVLDRLQAPDAPCVCDPSPVPPRPAPPVARAACEIEGGTYSYIGGRGTAVVSVSGPSVTVDMVWETGDRYHLAVERVAPGAYDGRGRVVAHRDFVNRAPPDAEFAVTLVCESVSRRIRIRSRPAAWGMDGLVLER